MFERLLEIDDSNRSGYYYLEKSDRCFYFGEREESGDFNDSPIRSLIANFKKSPQLKGSYQYKYKLNAINQIASSITRVIRNYTDFIFIPIPPSKAKNHEEYDNRLVDVLEACKRPHPDFIFADAIIQHDSHDSVHTSTATRPPPDERMKCYQLDVELIEARRGTAANFIIFDDLITTGSHFKAVQTLLGQHYPNYPAYGVFVARAARTIEEDVPAMGFKATMPDQ